MLRSTFQHLPGIGPVTEAALWGEGVLSWEDLDRRLNDGSAPVSRREVVQSELRRSQVALEAGDVEYFGRRLPNAEHWRIYPSFELATAFLDIETTSLSPFEGIVTVVTVHGGGRTRSFVADEDLEELPAYLRGFPLLVTFNGSLFDVPFLQVRFPQLEPPKVHVDLRFLLYRIGQAGGLKAIEQRLGLGDRHGVEGIHGLDAVRLWEEHRRGRPGALEKLVRYNRADTVNLEPLLRYAIRELRGRLPIPSTEPPSSARPLPGSLEAAVPPGGG
jgi:uncharacterized protein YprB with RNaseH-like and TPR domain